MKTTTCVTVFAAMLAAAGPIYAQSDISPSQDEYSPPPPEYYPRVEHYYTADVEIAPTALGYDLMGDSIDLDTGTLTFRHTDISIPGNSALPVRLGRRMDSEDYQFRNFGGWALDIPHVRVRTKDAAWHGQRCSDPMDEYNTTSSMYRGIALYSPGSGYKGFLKVDQSGSSPYFGTERPDHATKDFWRIDCMGSASNQWFQATDTAGTTYKFTKFYTQDGPIAYDHGLNNSANRYNTYEHIAYVTEVRDVHGNWVKYDYSDRNKGPTRIHSNDGRQVLVTYVSSTSPDIKSATANRTGQDASTGRKWNYAYANGGLTTVTRPDGQSWEFGFSRAPTIPANDLDGVCSVYDGEISLKHPMGAEATFKVRRTLNLRVNVPGRISGSARTSCVNRKHNVNLTESGGDIFSMAVQEKELVIPGSDTLKWTYFYEGGRCFDRNHNTDNTVPCDDEADYTPADTAGTVGEFNKKVTKARMIIEPDGTNKKLQYVNDFVLHQGQVTREEIHDSMAKQHRGQRWRRIFLTL